MKEFVIYIVIACVLQLLLQIDTAELQNTGVIGDNCTSDDQCNPGLFLHCWFPEPEETVGVCYCRDEFHYEDTKCRVQAEESCSVNPDCVKLSTCTSTGTDMVCKCNPGYKREKLNANLPAVCKALHDMPCDSQLDCRFTSGLGCTSEKICKCSSTFTTWSPPDERCLGQVGDTCYFEREERECVHGANCTSISEGSNYGNCKCAPSYQATMGRLCQLEFGAICKPGESEFSEQCNSDKHLNCGTEGKCECSSDKMIFDTECKVKPGGECDLDSNQDIPWSFRRKCILKAECQGQGDTSKVGICNCVKWSGDMCETYVGSGGNYMSTSLTGLMFLALVILNIKM